jgi:hypothetical protein
MTRLSNPVEPQLRKGIQSLLVSNTQIRTDKSLFYQALKNTYNSELEAFIILCIAIVIRVIVRDKSVEGLA